MKCTFVDNMAGKHELVTDLHTESILNMLGDARSHFTIVPASANTIKVRNYRHRKRLAQLAAARAAVTAAPGDAAGSTAPVEATCQGDSAML